MEYIISISKIFRLICLAIILAFGSYTSLLLFNESGSPAIAVAYLLPGPIILSIGIVFSFFSKRRPALVRIETVIGILLAAIGGIVGAFSIGGLLITTLMLIIPLLVVDSVLQGYIEKIRELTNSARNWVIAILVIFLCVNIFVLIWRLAIGFAILSIPLLVPWAILLFLSIISYLPKQKYLIYTLGILALFALVYIFYAQSKQPDFYAESYSSLQYSSSSSGGSSQALGSVSGSTGSENTEINYQELDKHQDWLSFRFNDKTIKVSPSSRTVFYGLLSKKNADLVVLQLRDGKKIKSKILDNMYVAQTNIPQAEEKLTRIILLDKNHKEILNEGIDGIDDEFIE